MLLSNQFLLPLQGHAAQSLMLDPQHLLFSQTANHTTTCHNSVKRNLLIGKLTRILCNTTRTQLIALIPRPLSTYLTGTLHAISNHYYQFT